MDVPQAPNIAYRDVSDGEQRSKQETYQLKKKQTKGYVKN